MAEGVKEARESEGHPVMGWIGYPDPTRKGADCWLVPTIAKDSHGHNRLETLDNACH